MQSTRPSDRYFFLTFAGYYMVTMLVGFSHSTSEVLSRDGGLRTIAIVHGAFGTAWLLLFVAQVVLISARKRKLHMTLGKATLPIMAGVFVTGILALLRLHLPVEKMPRDLMASEVGLFVLGLVYAVLGIVFRRDAASHKRYMLMSMILLSPAGVARFMTFLGYESAPIFAYLIVIFFVPLLSILAYDLIAYRRVFRGTVVGLVLYVLNMFLGQFYGGFVVDALRPLLV